jgi:hypothetical protein
MFTFHSGDTNTDTGPAIPIVASWTQTNPGDVDVSALSMDPPPDIQAGNSLMIFAYSSNNSSHFGDIVPSGWEFLGFTKVTENPSINVGVFYKKTASGSEGAVTIVPATSAHMLGTYMRITGANQTTLIDVSDYDDIEGSSSSSDIPSLTTSIDNCLALFGAVQNFGSGADITLDDFPRDSGFAILDQDNTGLAHPNITSVFGFKEIPTAGTTEGEFGSDLEVEWDASERSGYFMLAIRPD